MFRKRKQQQPQPQSNSLYKNDEDDKDREDTTTSTTPPRTNTHTRHRTHLYLAILLVGFVLGLFVGDSIHMSTMERNNNNMNNNKNTPFQQQQEENKNNGGWKDIHVFYGNRQGLGENKQQSSYAQAHQDQVVLQLIQNATKQKSKSSTSYYFIDLAANDAKEYSNTLVLERYPEWNGLCIEPNPIYWYGLSHRKCTVVAALVGGNDNESQSQPPVQVKFRGVYGGIVGKMNDKLANFKKEPEAPRETRYTASLAHVLQKYKVPKMIDYLSLDIEGAEYMVMQHFPFHQYTIRIMTVERPSQPLHDLFIQHGYVHLKDLTWWGETLWAHKSTGFTPDHPSILNIPTEQRN